MMAFVRSPDKHSIELLQKGDPLPPEGAMDLHAEHREVVSALPAAIGACDRRRCWVRLPCRTAKTPLYVAAPGCASTCLAPFV